MNLTKPITVPVVVIMAGGEGKRLWPISTPSKPKQLQALFSRKAMVVETFERALKIVPKEQVYVVATEQLAGKLKKLLRLSEKNLIVQPKNMDTAAAMSVTALHLEYYSPNSTAVFMYSDHHIADSKQFTKTIKHAVSLASQYDAPMLIGTPPLTSNTQFGYIKLGEKLNDDSLYTVASFIEKPNQAKAEALVTSGDHVWNTGIKIWRTAGLLQAIKTLLPKEYESLLALRSEIGGSKYADELREWYMSLKPVSFEKAISEHFSGLMVYAADYEWDDMGNWEVYYSLAQKDSQQNAIINALPGQDVQLLSSKRCLVLPRQQQVVVIGLEDVFVVQSDDKLLICRRDLASKIKDLAKD